MKKAKFMDRRLRQEQLDETRWMHEHFDDDPLEKESIRITMEILKTVVVLFFGLLVWTLV